MAKKEKNILQEAVADAKEIKEAAVQNATNVMMEHFKGQMKDFMDKKLNEGDSYSMQHEGEEHEEEEMTENEDLDVEETELGDEEDEGLDLASELGDDDEEDEGEGLTSDDLDEAISAALEEVKDDLSEVDHPDLGEPEFVAKDKRADSRGLMDEDPKEAGWEEKDAPDKHNYYSVVKENKKLKSRIAQLVKESVLTKKANQKLRATLDEVKLFNRKVLYATKLLQNEGVGRGLKSKIVTQLDGTTSLQEAKNVYETWKVALGAISESASRSTKTKKTSLSEALGSQKGTGKGVTVESLDLSHLDEADPLLEGNTYSKARLQRVAGIYKD